jgi:hypothetical protein
MKSKLGFIFILSLLSSCGENTSKQIVEILSVNTEINYFQDKETLKCFAVRNHQIDDRDFTCVPCDSLVMLKINQN